MQNVGRSFDLGLEINHEDLRQLTESVFTGGVAVLAGNLLPPLQKTIWIGSALLGAGQDYAANISYNRFNPKDKTNWGTFIVVNLGMGLQIMSAKIMLDLMIKNKTDYDVGVIFTASIVNTVSATLFRWVTRQ